jgi:hypothetical protein
VVRTAVLAAVLAALPLLATAPHNVRADQATAQQQIIDFDLAAPADLAGCTVIVYSDAGRTVVVQDSDTTIRANAQACNRGALDTDLSSIVSQGTHVQFISGLRGTRKSAADNLLHSMSLAPLTTYYYTIAAGSASVNGQFTTATIPVGANFPDAPLSDTTGTNVNGLQYPYIADNAPGTIVNDPTTGIPIVRVPSLLKLMIGLAAFSTTAIDVAATGHWTNLANCGSNNASVCTGTGAGATDYLFLPFPLITPPQSSAGRYGGWTPYYFIDDMVFTPYCGSTTVQQTLQVWLTRDSGQTAASGSFLVTCPVGSAVSRPAISDTVNGYPHPFWNQWAPVKEWIKPEIIPGSGTVSTIGTAVTLTLGDPFVTSIPANSNILIGSTYYKIASFTDSSHLTLTGSAGTQTGAAYRMASTGLRIANVTATNAVTLSMGYNAAETLANGYGTFEANSPPCNINPISVSWAADGITAIPTTKGYLCTNGDSGNSVIFLYVPFNADGSIRLDVRAVSVLYTNYVTHMDTAGDATSSVGNYSFGGWDSGDPLTLYVQNFESKILKLHYDTTISTPCAHFASYAYGAANGFVVYPATGQADCFQWTNLTPQTSSPSKKPRDQVVAAWASGLNQLGQQVGQPHPLMTDIGWMGNPTYLSIIQGSPTGCMTMFASAEGFAINPCFDLTTGILKSLTDSFYAWPTMAGQHSADTYTTPGMTWSFLASNPMPGWAGTTPFYSSFQAAVSQVNRAGFGATASWDSTTTITGANNYTCPTTFSDPKVSTYFGAYAGTANCLQVRLSTPMCSHHPALNAAGGGYDFAGGQSESQAFPCTTPGFGVPSGASGYSKLWDIFPGMWLWVVSDGQFFAENFVVATAPSYNAANDITVWLLRAVKDKYWVPLSEQGDTFTCADNGTFNHANGWTLGVFPPFGCGGGQYWWDTSDPTGTMYWQHGTMNGHGTVGSGTLPNTFTRIAGGGHGYYLAQPNMASLAPASASVNSIPLLTANTTSKFSGFAFTSVAMQSYPNLTAATPLASPNDRKLIDNRSLNPGPGWSVEYNASCISAATLTTTLQGSTTQTYLLSDPTGTIATTDLHVSALAHWAGPHYLRDYSSPSTGNIFGDAQTYGFCYVYKVNECRTGSAAGTVYVSVPFAENTNACIQSDQNTMNVPGVLNLAPIGGQTVQVDPYVFDPNQVLLRKLGFGFRAPGMQYTFQHTWGMPDGRGIMGRIDWADNRWAGLYVGAMPPWPADVGNATNGYYDQALTFAAVPNASNARVLFGYAENGSTPPANPTAPPGNPASQGGLYCMTRQDTCSTEGNGAPFAFVMTPGERVLTPCAGGCDISVPLIRGRVALVQQQWLDGNGAVVSYGPVRAIAVP